MAKQTKNFPDAFQGLQKRLQRIEPYTLTNSFPGGIIYCMQISICEACCEATPDQITP